MPLSPTVRRHHLSAGNAAASALEAKVLLAAPSALNANFKFKGTATESTRSVAQNAGRDKGVTPTNSSVSATLQANGTQDRSNDINQALRKGGTVRLGEGKFFLNSTLTIGSNTTLEGAGKGKTILVYQNSRKHAVSITGSNSGIRNLTVSTGLYENGARPDLDRHRSTHKDNRSSGLLISGNQNFADQIVVRGSGNDPLIVTGNKNTIVRSTFEQPLNRAGSEAYVGFNAGASQNLLANNFIHDARHIVINTGSKQNVLAGNTTNSDFNFHSGDGGSNLISGNELNVPRHNRWGGFSSGNPKGNHALPGKGNVVVNNTGPNVRVIATSALFKPNQVYTVTGFTQQPGGERFYETVNNDPIIRIG
jgi:hypothetical protein